MARRSKAAYRLIDIGEVPDTHRQELMEDIAMGGVEFGVREVEVIHNGPARQPIYGIYFGPDEAKWEAAQKEFGVEAPEGLSEEEAEAREEALRQQREKDAAEEADRIREAEEAEVRRVTKEEAKDDKSPAKTNKAK